MSEDETVVPFPRRPRKARKEGCPICGKPADVRHEPFCSPRCKQIDLGRWLNGSYRVETEERPEEPGGEPGDDEGRSGG